MLVEELPPDLDPVSACSLLANLGFLAHSDLPDRPGPAYLLVAIRPVPTLHHYDPEQIEYWVTEEGRGRPRELTRDSRLPIDRSFSWGLIRITDRLGVSNEYLTFGGRLRADVIEATIVAAFGSPAPLLRRGGHSQGWDDGAECVGAFFGRIMLAVDYVESFEARFAAAEPAARYATFISDALQSYRDSPALRAAHPDLWITIQAEEHRLRACDPGAWATGAELRAAIEPILRIG
jgi:hypothetical protein